MLCSTTSLPLVRLSARVSALAAAASFSLGAAAQTAPPVFSSSFSSQPRAVAALPDMVVTASRNPVPINDLLADVSVIDRQTLAQAGQGSLGDLLAQLPGVQLSATGSYRSSTGVFLRGASASQTIVLIDGMRVGSATSGGTSFENLPLERIERIEVLRGAASALYGPDAVGGVIQIFTRAPTGELDATARVGAGSDGLRSAGASLRGSAGPVGYSLGMSREQATGISTRTNALSADFSPDSDGFKSSSVDAKLTARLHPNHLLSLSLLQSKTNYAFDGRPFPNPGNSSGLAWDARSDSGLKNATLAWQAQMLDQWKSTVTVGTSQEESVSSYQRLVIGVPGADGKFNTNRRQITWQNDIAVGQDVLSLVLEKRSETVDSSTAYTVPSRTVSSAMASYAVNQKAWNALLVLRQDRNSQFGHFNNWALSGGYRLTDSLRAVASMGTSFQAPSFNQLYFPGFGNPGLEPQRNRSAEVGLKYLHAGLSLGAVLYHNRINGFIVPSTNVQQSSAKLQGVSLTADSRAGSLAYAVSYDYTDPRTQSVNPAADNLRLVRVAQHVLNARVSRNFGEGTSVFGELKISSNREDNKVAGTGRDRLPGYATLNLGGNHALSQQVSLLLRVNNLFNKRYALANGFSTPGVNVFAAVSYAL